MGSVANIWGNAQIFYHKIRSHLNFLTMRTILFYFLSVYGLASPWIQSLILYSPKSSLLAPTFLCMALVNGHALKSVYFIYLPVCIHLCHWLLLPPSVPPFLMSNATGAAPFYLHFSFLRDNCPRCLSCYFGLQAKQLKAMPDCPQERKWMPVTIPMRSTISFLPFYLITVLYVNSDYWFVFLSSIIYSETGNKLLSSPSVLPQNNNYKKNSKQLSSVKIYLLFFLFSKPFVMPDLHHAFRT